MPPAGKDERSPLVTQRGGYRPDAFALQIDVEDGQVETALLGLGQRLADRVAGAANRMTHRFEEILEHHRNQRLILDNQDGTRADMIMGIAAETLEERAN